MAYVLTTLTGDGLVEPPGRPLSPAQITVGPHHWPEAPVAIHRTVTAPWVVSSPSQCTLQ